MNADIEERMYDFTVSRGPSNTKNYSKKESELDDKEINLLVGTYYHEYSKLPPLVRKRILEIIKL